MQRLVLSLFLLVSTPAFAIRVGPPVSVGRVGFPQFVAVDDGFDAFWTDAFWTDAPDSFAARLAFDGTVLERKPLFHGMSVVSAVRDGDTIVVVAQRALGIPSSILAYRVSPDLSFVSGPAFLGTGERAKIRAGRGGFVIAWAEPRPPTPLTETLVVSRLSAALSITRQVRLEVTPQARVGTFDLATSEVGTLVVWNQNIGCDVPSGLPCIITARLRAARFDANLNLLDPASIDVAPADASIGSVVWDGRQWLIFFWPAGRGVGLARVDPSGIVAEVGKVIVQSGTEYFSIPNAARVGDDVVVVAPIFSYVSSSSSIEIKRLAGDDVHLLLSGFMITPMITPGDSARALLAYSTNDGWVIRVIDFAAAEARPRPARR